MPFQQLGLSGTILSGVQAMGFTDPTPIQLRAIPPLLEGKDIIGSAQTGTGKTAAFALPILARIGSHGPCRCLVLEPTRELAAQVETAFRNYGRFTDIRVTALYGGVGYGLQRKQLRDGVDIIVATPGRLEDHLQQRSLDLKGIDILVLDEVDRMLDIGFLPAVKRIIGKCNKVRQTLFFTATLPPELKEISEWALKDPVRIEIGATRSVTATVTHALYPVSFGKKFDLLTNLLESIDFQSVLVFSRTKHGADKIAKRLRDMNHSVAVLHANRSQRQRASALAGFKSGQYEILVATDIAARGIDVAGISHVINYDIPQHPEDYVHRIGRTGRAQSTGDAFTLVAPDEEKHVRAIERFIGREIPRLKLAGFSDPDLAQAQSRAKSGSGSQRPPSKGGQSNRSSYGQRPPRYGQRGDSRPSGPRSDSRPPRAQADYRPADSSRPPGPRDDRSPRDSRFSSPRPAYSGGKSFSSAPRQGNRPPQSSPQAKSTGEKSGKIFGFFRKKSK